MSLLQTTKENLHHTNICVGSRDIIKQDIETCISELSKSVSKVEHLSYEYDKFLVKDAEHIFQTHLHKTGENELQIISIYFNSTNRETQNKILKMLEEPRPQTYFFLVLPKLHTLLPTILSRGQVFTYQNKVEIDQEAEDFILGTYVYRLEYIKNFLEEVKDEQKTKQDALEFLEKIEKYIHVKKDIKSLKKIIQIKEYARDPGASLKQLLEYVAVTL